MPGIAREIRAQICNLKRQIGSDEPQWPSEVLCRMNVTSPLIRLCRCPLTAAAHFDRLRNGLPLYLRAEDAAQALVAELTEQLFETEARETDRLLREQMESLAEERGLQRAFESADGYWAAYDRQRALPSEPEICADAPTSLEEFRAGKLARIQQLEEQQARQLDYLRQTVVGEDGLRYGSHISIIEYCETLPSLHVSRR